MRKEKKIRLDTIESVRADYLENNYKENESSRRNRFNHALDVEILEDIQFGNDYLIISENLIEWKSKLKKTDSRWLVLNVLSGALMRIYFYTKQLETKLRAAVSEYQIFREQNNRLLDTNEKLRNEIKSLKKEIEFLNNG